MLRGYYNAAQAMLVKQRELDTISNNIANVNTAGFKKDTAVLDTFQREFVLVRQRKAISGKVQQTYLRENITDLEQSNLTSTESPFDVAVIGNMYLNVKVPDNASWAPDFTETRRTAAGTGVAPSVYPPGYVQGGEVPDENGYQNPPGQTLLTRNGQFELDGDGYLCLNDGAAKAMRVQGEGGDIQIGTKDFVISDTGVISTYDRNDASVPPVEVARLALTYVPPSADVQKIGNTLFRYDGEQAGVPDGERYAVVQGAFERSNVDPNEEMTKAMRAQRMYEANSKVLQAFQQVNQIASTIASFQ